METPNSLRKMRMNTGMRQIDVAEKLGLTSSDRISHWEKGVAVPGLVNLFKLAIIYKTTPEHLYSGLYAELGSSLSSPQVGTPKTEPNEIR
ncbi:MAG: hypothetical protein RIT04_552 [Candidatus Parcubacteria bacterium]|jgi:transcriptional regulator with XRE-family HTH domain